MAVNPMLVGGIGVGVTAVAVTGGLYAGGVIGGETSAQKPTNTGAQDTNQKPDWIPASEDSTAGADYGTSKYANKYQKYLVGVNPKDADNKARSNDAWWEWAYKTVFKSNKGKVGKFKTVTSWKDGATSLKTVCQAAYKAEGSSIVTDGSEVNDDSKFKEEDIWSFCSSGGKKIKTLKDVATETYSSGQYGEGENKRSELVATHQTATDNNKWFWDLKQKELKDAKDLTNDNSKFKTLNKILNGTVTAQSEDKSTLKELCTVAYGQNVDTGTSGAYPQTEVFRFCSLNGTVPTGA